MRQRIRSSIVALVVLVLLVSAASATVSTHALAQHEPAEGEQSVNASQSATGETDTDSITLPDH